MNKTELIAEVAKKTGISNSFYLTDERFQGSGRHNEWQSLY